MRKAALLVLLLALLATTTFSASSEPNAWLTVPTGAVLTLAEKNYSGYNYRPFTAVEPLSVEQSGALMTYGFSLTDGKTYRYHAADDTHAPTTELFSFSGANCYEKTIALSDSRDTVVRDPYANNGYNVADIYLNINEAGWLQLGAVGDTYRLVPLRRWEAVDQTVSNHFVEPDYHFTVLGEDFTESHNVVTVSDSGLITAVGEGTAIVLVTYDAMNAPGALGGACFGAIWPENTGVFTVTVGAQEELSTGISLDAELDVIYYAEEHGAYTFTPGDGCEVSVANPIVDRTLTYGGFVPQSAAEDGSVTVPLKEGRNIVRVAKDGQSAYQIITAKRVSVTVNDGAPVHPGDELTIRFDRLYHPVNKLAGVYNMSALAVYTNVNGADGLLAGGATAQYDFTSNRGAQTISNLLRRELDAFGNSAYRASAALSIPADYQEQTFTLSGGALVALGFGDAFGSHREITLEGGKGVNLSAEYREKRFGRLPDITIPVAASDAAPAAVELCTDGVKTSYTAGDSFDTTNLIVTARFPDGTEQTITDYTVAPEILTSSTAEIVISYRGISVSLPVAVAAPTIPVVPGAAAPEEITVTFSLLGDSPHGSSGEIHTYQKHNLETWILPVSVHVSPSASVLDVIEKALGGAGIAFENPGGAYIRSVRGLREMDNGANSGWMYLLNGEHPSQSVANQTVLNGDEIILHYTDDYTLEFRAKSDPGINGTATGKTGEKTPQDEQTAKTPIAFSDVSAGAWYNDAVSFIAEAGIMNGTGEDRFSPEQPMTRAMLMTMLARLSGVQIKGENWREMSVSWAIENGVSDGTNPEASITREQLAAMLFRYTRIMNGGFIDVMPASLDYADGAMISDWAYEPVRWCTGNKLLTGFPDAGFHPQGVSTRAQVAVIIMRYIRLTEKSA